MPIGLPASRQSRCGLAFKAALTLLCLGLAAPSQAGWLGHLLGTGKKPAAVSASSDSSVASSAKDTTSPSAPLVNPSSDSVATQTSEAPGNAADDIQSNDGTDAAGHDAIANHKEKEQPGDSNDNEILLPNVEESELGTVDTPDTELSADQLAAFGDLWERLRHGFQMDSSIDNDRIAVQRNWYLRNTDYLDRMALRATRYLHYTVGEAEKRKLPTELALLPVIESAYDPFAYSHANAAGMWQFIPGTARLMGVKQDWWFDGRRDVVESTRAAYDFLSQLYAQFGDWQLALAAYNAGPGTVQRAINRNAAAGLPTDFWSLRLPAETRAYVPRFLAVVQIVKSPESFGITLRPVLNQPFFRIISTTGQVDMPAAAELAGVSLKEFYQLNSGFSRQATDPEGPHRLLVPAALPGDLEAQIAALPVPDHVVAETYKIKKGDTLARIARRFNITPAELKNLNALKSNKVPVGRTLTVTRANANPEFLALNQEMRLDRSYATGSKVHRAFYKVRRGDTLASIARRHGVSTRTLARWNGISTHSHVHAGQRLSLQVRVRGGKHRIASIHRKGMHKIRYQVRRGDTLASIGKRYNVSVTQIKSWNGSAGNLHPGQGIVLFVASNTRNGNL